MHQSYNLSHGPLAQDTRLQAHFAADGHQASVTGGPVDAERLAAEIERHCWTREVRTSD